MLHYNILAWSSYFDVGMCTIRPAIPRFHTQILGPALRDVKVLEISPHSSNVLLISVALGTTILSGRSEYIASMI